MSKKETTIKNLRLLIQAWEKARFNPNMGQYGGIHLHSHSKIKFGEVNDCGTNCCALGYAPSVEGLEVQESDITNFGRRIDYWEYSVRIFPAIRPESYKWQYLFGGYWPDDRKAFIERANKLIESDLVLTPKMIKEIEELINLESL